MKHSLLAAACLAAISLAGCNQEPAAPADTVASTTPAQDMATAPANADQAFADAVAASDMFEIETSRLAQEKARSDKVKRFAKDMIDAHTESTAKLANAASAVTPAITPAGRLAPAQQQALEALAEKSGDEFDAAYIKTQIDAHNAALVTLKAYSDNGHAPSLKTFAAELVPVVTGHLDMAKGL